MRRPKFALWEQVVYNKTNEVCTVVYVGVTHFVINAKTDGVNFRYTLQSNKTGLKYPFVGEHAISKYTW